MKRKPLGPPAKFVAIVRKDGTTYYELCCSRCGERMGDSMRSEPLPMNEEVCRTCVEYICMELDRRLSQWDVDV